MAVPAKIFLVNLVYHRAFAGDGGAIEAFVSEKDADARVDVLEADREAGKGPFTDSDDGYYEVVALELTPSSKTRKRKATAKRPKSKISADLLNMSSRLRKR